MRSSRDQFRDHFGIFCPIGRVRVPGIWRHVTNTDPTAIAHTINVISVNRRFILLGSPVNLGTPPGEVSRLGFRLDPLQTEFDALDFEC